jgi:hypothetical protein
MQKRTDARQAVHMTNFGGSRATEDTEYRCLWAVYSSDGYRGTAGMVAR